MTIPGIPPAWLAPDPVLPLPSREQMLSALRAGDAGIARLEQALRDRAEAVRLRETDPLRYGFEPDCFGDVRKLIASGFEEIYVTGGNREGKTTLLDKLIVEDLAARKCEWALFHNSEQTSINQQQSRIFSFFPPDLRARVMAKPMKRNVRFSGNTQAQSVYLAYNEATGFSNAKFIFPGTGSKCYFFNYGQASSVWEGPEYDGILFEEAVTLDVLETSRYRRGKGRRLLILINFTPKWGFTPVVQNILAGATIVETRPAPLLEPDVVHVRGCPPGHMPYIMHGARPQTAIIFFHNRMNPLGAGEEIAAQLNAAPKSRIMIRGYGWAERGEMSAFPKFGKAHIVTQARWETLRKGPGTWYLVSDPGSASKNWFFQWWYATPGGHHILAKEWPDRARYEEWAISPSEAEPSSEAHNARRHDWRRGPAQRIEAGRSIASYKSLLLTEEGWRYNPKEESWETTPDTIRVYRRLMDPAFGGSEVPTDDEGATPIELMSHKGQRDAFGRQVPPMEWEQASRGTSARGSGGFKADRAQLLADWLDWNETKPLAPDNCPRLYVVEACQQSIQAFNEYVPPPWSTSKNALCEPIDTAGYYAKSDLQYIDPQLVRVSAPRWW